jgi:hypothetical protein
MAELVVLGMIEVSGARSPSSSKWFQTMSWSSAIHRCNLCKDIASIRTRSTLRKPLPNGERISAFSAGAPTWGMPNSWQMLAGTFSMDWSWYFG